MRYSVEHKKQNHQKILSVAARSFREHGGDTSGIGTVMKKVGMTKGGFYRHFKSKDDLFVEAVARAFDEMGSGYGGSCQVRTSRSSVAGHDRALSKRASCEFGGDRLRALCSWARTRAEIRYCAEKDRGLIGGISRATAAIHTGSDERRKTCEIQVVVPQHGGSADDGPGYFGASKTGADVGGCEGLFYKVLR